MSSDTRGSLAASLRVIFSSNGTEIEKEEISEILNTLWTEGYRNVERIRELDLNDYDRIGIGRFYARIFVNHFNNVETVASEKN